jgi:hypothetical protein
MSRNKNDPEMLEARLRYFIGCSLVVILGGTIFAVLYSLVFITQPLEVSPNDQKFFELLTPLASFIVGALGGVLAAGNSSKRNDGNDEPPKQEYTE